MNAYGAFNISLINDLPVFIDPFLLFNRDKPEYQKLHEKIIEYITFLRKMSEAGTISQGLLQHWFLFPEVKQNWLGFSKIGNGGSGLGAKFAAALNDNLSTIFTNFGTEQVTKSSHLEKLCLVFANSPMDKCRTKSVLAPHAEFNYQTRRWCGKKFTLPYIGGDYVLLTPKDILTKDEAWINKHDIIGDFLKLGVATHFAEPFSERKPSIYFW